jgi:thioredoxin reductase (NADPH)
LSEIIDLAIIGGGPAGMTAGLYAARAKLKVILLEKLSPGGQILNTHWVDNYPGFPEGLAGFELVERMKNQAIRFGLDIVSSEVLSVAVEGNLFRLHGDRDKILTKAIIVATGAQPIQLGIPGEKELWGKGVSYCATCDGPFYRDVEVAVVGGGDTAVEEALFLTRFASKVHLFHRRDELRACGLLKDKIKADPKVEIHWCNVLEKIGANEQGAVAYVDYLDVNTGVKGRIQVEGVFMFVGQRPISDFLKGFVDFDDRGFIITDMEMATSRPGIFAAGDVRAKQFRQISTAVGDGAAASFAVEKYLEENFG